MRVFLRVTVIPKTVRHYSFFWIIQQSPTRLSAALVCFTRTATRVLLVQKWREITPVVKEKRGCLEARHIYEVKRETKHAARGEHVSQQHLPTTAPLQITLTSLKYSKYCPIDLFVWTVATIESACSASPPSILITHMAPARSDQTAASFHALFTFSEGLRTMGYARFIQLLEKIDGKTKGGRE